MTAPPPGLTPPRLTTPPPCLLNRLITVRVEKGLAEHEAVDAVVASFENDMGPVNGAKVVARAWTDPDYREWL